MGNLEIYNKVRKVPEEAKKTIQGGRLKGKTDINPMWRLKTLTEQFGMVGIGWYTEVIERWLETGANGEVSAFVHIHLFVMQDNKWSMPIVGLGGSMFVAKESSGMYTSDECYKMAYTDAISVACKAIGIGADVYWEKDATKYDQEPKKVNPVTEAKKQYKKPTPQEELHDLAINKVNPNIIWSEVLIQYNVSRLGELSDEQCEEIRRDYKL